MRPRVGLGCPNPTTGWYLSGPRRGHNMNRAYQSFVWMLVSIATCACAQEKGEYSDRPRFKWMAIENSTVLMSPREMRVTGMCFDDFSPPPWDKGNLLSLVSTTTSSDRKSDIETSWQVVNMHAENFCAVTKLLNCDSLKLRVFPRATYYGLSVSYGEQPFDVLSMVHRILQKSDLDTRRTTNNTGYALVVDKRVRRDWLLTEPANMLPEEEAVFREKYRRHFRERAVDWPDGQFDTAMQRSPAWSPSSLLKQASLQQLDPQQKWDVEILMWNGDNWNGKAPPASKALLPVSGAQQ